MFTDWSVACENARYFYMRGALWGIVAASLVWRVLVLSVRRWVDKGHK